MSFWKKNTDNTTAPVGRAGPPEETDAEKISWAKRLSAGLAKSSQKLTAGIVDAVTKYPLDQKALDRLEEILIESDLGPSLAAKLVADFAATRFGKDVSAEEVKTALAQQIAVILKNVTPVKAGDHFLGSVAGDTKTEKPVVILVIGVNGSGKTTTIGKLAQRYRDAGKRVMLAAGDTFRAAAVEQLQIWGQRTGATVTAKGLNTDAAAVAFEAVEKAQADGTDIVMIDTAGRLHNKANLMEELAKICRVIQKRLPEAPHAVILTLDATVGQNAMAQVEQFNAIIPLTGLIVTKLDGSAKAGIVVALADRYKIPVAAIGVGEAVEDLQAFDPVAFAKSLTGAI